MVRTCSMLAAAALALAALTAPTTAFTVTLRNKCSHTVELFDAKTVESISIGGSIQRWIEPNSGAHVYRHSRSAQATLAEFSGDGGMAWFDISIIPTGPKSGPEYCPSLGACKSLTGGVGFNVPMQIAPSSPDGNRCRVLTCLGDGCGDAYQYPKDDTKTHTCPLNTNFDVTFCPNGSGGQAPPPPSTPAPTPPPTTKAPTPPPTTQAPTPPPTTKAPSTPAPTPSPTPEPTTAAPTPTPTPEIGNEGSSSSSSSSKTLLRTGASSSEDRSIADTDTDTTTTTATAGVTDDVSTTSAPAATAAPVASDAIAAGETTNAGGVTETTTKSGDSVGNSPGMVFVAIFCAVGMVAGIAIVAVRRKKAQLDALETKTPVNITATNDRRMMMTTPSGSCVL